MPDVVLGCAGDQTLQGGNSGFEGNTVTVTGLGFRFLGSNHRVQGINGAGGASGPSNRIGTFSISLAPGTR